MCGESPKVGHVLPGRFHLKPSTIRTSALVLPFNDGFLYLQASPLIPTLKKLHKISQNQTKNPYFTQTNKKSHFYYLYGQQKTLQSENSFPKGWYFMFNVHVQDCNLHDVSCNGDGFF
jgi:hypothetical protein